MHTIPFEILTLEKDGHHIIVDVELLDQTFKMVVDTGASKTVLDKNTLHEIGLTEEDLTSSNILSSGLGTNEMQSHTLSLDTFGILNWKIKNFEVAVLDLSAINYAYSQMNFAPVIGVLGGDILTQYGAIINYKKRTLTLNIRKSKSTTI